MSLEKDIKNLNWFDHLRKLKDILLKMAVNLFVDAPTDGKQYARKNGDWDEVSSYTPSFRVYTALLTQSGTSAPTAVLLENTTDLTPVFKYTSTGKYSIELGQFIPKDKIKLSIGQPRFTSTLGETATVSYEFVDDTGNIGVYQILTKQTINATGITTLQNNYLFRTPIEIRIYN